MKFGNTITVIGSSNVLNWAIANKASIKDDPALQSIVNDDTGYMVEFDDVNFFELFRLAQMYRDRLRIRQENQLEKFEEEALEKIFPGEYKKDDETDPVKLASLVSCSLDAFTNLAMQMNSDPNAVPSSSARLFLPMFSRRFDVSIPVSFADIIGCMKPEEIEEAYSDVFPRKDGGVILDSNSNVNMMLRLGFDRGTRVIRYDKQYEKYLKMLKYAPLNSFKGDGLFKCSLLSFDKYDPISRYDIRCSMFHADRDKMKSTMKRMATLDTPLKADFTIQLPIQYMMMLMNSYSRDELPTMYESSISDIIETGISYNDFITMEEGEEGYDERVSAISDYQVRISDARNITMNAIEILLKQAADSDISSTDIFSILPAIYNAKATITVSEDKLEKFTSDTDPVLASMFDYIANTMHGLKGNIEASK